MKKILFFLTFTLYSLFALCSTTTIINSGYTFSPSSVTITLGDSVKFVLASIHTAVEVNQTTWNASGTTPLSGGFSTAFGGGLVLPANLTVGTHYYVCSVHGSIGMKGVIIVQSSTGINENRLPTDISVYPNPSSEKFTIATSFSSYEGYNLEIYNIVGDKIYSDKIMRPTSYVVHHDWPNGIYFLSVKTSDGIAVKKIVISH